MVSKIFLTLAASVALIGCAAENPIQSTRQKVVSVICTPGEEMCDFCCEKSGGPSSDDCIVQCSDDGTEWLPSVSCGWAQNGRYSSSCLDTPTGAVCEWN